MHGAEEPIARLTKQIEDLVPTWSMAPIVEAFQAMRGVAFVAAVTVVGEVGDFTGFDNPRQVMAYLGLTPSEHSSGTAIRRGGITKAGNALARRVLIEGAGPIERRPASAASCMTGSRDFRRSSATSAGRLRSGSAPAIEARSDRQAQGRCDDCNRAGDAWISLGDCTLGADR